MQDQLGVWREVKGAANSGNDTTNLYALLVTLDPAGRR